MSARERAEQRIQRFLDSATELIEEKGVELTVQEVVERSGQSLRSFYQSFEGKHHLLLAVYEQAMSASAEEMRRVVATQEDPLERLRLFVVTLYEWCEREPAELPSAPHRTTRSLASFTFSQLMLDPQSAVSATASMFDQLVALIVDAQRIGAVGPGSAGRLATFVLQSTMFCAFGAPTHRQPERHRERAEQMWNLCLNGVSG